VAIKALGSPGRNMANQSRLQVRSHESSEVASRDLVVAFARIRARLQTRRTEASCQPPSGAVYGRAIPASNASRPWNL